MSLSASECLYQYPASYSMAVGGFEEDVHAPDSVRARSLETLYGYTDSVSPESSITEYDSIATAYFANMRASDPAYYEFVSTQERYLAHRWPDAKQATVVIAAASHEEGDTIAETLAKFGHDTKLSDVEVVLFLNMPRFNLTGRPNSAQRTQRAIRKFIDENPRFPLRVFSHVYREPQPIGAIKKTVMDVVALRALRADFTDPIAILSDADVAEKPDNYLHTVLEPFSETYTDAVIGHLDWSHASMKSRPELFVATRLYQIIDEASRKNSGLVATPGACTALRLGPYLLAGATPPTPRGEDVLLGLQLQRLREGSPARIVRPEQTTAVLQSSARRNVIAFDEGLAPNEKWRMGFGINDPLIRKHTAAPSAGNNPASINIRRLEKVLSRTLNAYENTHPSVIEYYNRVVNALGVAATVNIDAQSSLHVSVQDASRAEQLINDLAS